MRRLEQIVISCRACLAKSELMYSGYMCNFSNTYVTRDVRDNTINESCPLKEEPENE